MVVAFYAPISKAVFAVSTTTELFSENKWKCEVRGITHGPSMTGKTSACIEPAVHVSELTCHSSALFHTRSLPILLPSICPVCFECRGATGHKVTRQEPTWIQDWQPPYSRRRRALQ